MSRAARIAAGVVSVAVLAGLTAMAVPALLTIGGVAEGLSSTAEILHAPDEADLIATDVNDDPVATNTTDYSTWSDADLAAARAEDPNPYVINHPSRFAGNCLQNSMMTAVGALEGAQTLVDMGPTEYARGTVTVNAEGALTTYTVAAGDAGMAIGERFCVDYVTLFQYNGIYPAPDPGDVLFLLPSWRL